MEQQDYGHAESMYKMCLNGEKSTLPLLIKKLFDKADTGTLDSGEIVTTKDGNAKMLMYESHGASFDLIKSIKRVCGEISPPTMILLGNLAVLYMKQGREEEAEEQFLECLRLKERTLGPKHESTLGTVLNLAAFYREKAGSHKQIKFGDDDSEAKRKNDELVRRSYESSVLQYKRALSAQEEQYGENSEVTMATVEALASLNLEMGETENTLGYLERILTTKTVQLGKDNPETLAVLENVAHIHSVRGNHDMARTFYMKAKTAREALFKEAHPSTLAVYSQLALLEERLGNFNKAREMYDKMVEGVIKTWAEALLPPLHDYG